MTSVSPRLAALALGTLGILFAGFAFPAAPAAQYRPSSVSPPKPLREFRGAWLASVSNIDWPSRPGLSTADQKAELIAILNRAAQVKLNVIILQVRPACDALYASRLEPWSDYLTDTMGKAPAPFYDPLQFAVDEAHRRGLKLHAWFNPYRAHHPSARSPIAPNHISKTRPQLVRSYGNLLWLDPGEKEVQNHSLNVVLDVVKRYDIDGVHFDDYFYPYKVRDSSGAEADFPDDPSWQRFGAGGKLSRDDWRRENVNTFIERVYTSIKTLKPWVEFGVSPFGIWRPGHPPQIEGHDAYAKLYADSRLWISKGTLDYLAPQLYWSIDAPEQSFPVLLKWWSEQNPKRRHLIPGMDSTKTGRRWAPSEIINQIQLTRKQPGTAGHIHWNMRSVRGDLAQALETQAYLEPALPPATPWLQMNPLRKPTLKARASANSVALSWEPAQGDKVSLWLLQSRAAGKWSTQILPAHTRSQRWKTAPEVIALTAIGRTGLPSPSHTVEKF